MCLYTVCLTRTDPANSEVKSGQQKYLQASFLNIACIMISIVIFLSDFDGSQHPTTFCHCSASVCQCSVLVCQYPPPVSRGSSWVLQCPSTLLVPLFLLSLLLLFISQAYSAPSQSGSACPVCQFPFLANQTMTQMNSSSKTHLLHITSLLIHLIGQ